MRWLLVVAALVGVGCGGDHYSRAVGARCQDDRDCDDVCLGPSGDYPDGFCSLTCIDDRDCPGDAACVKDEGGVCLFTCAGDADCRGLGAGWRCRARDAQGAPGQVLVCRGG